MSFKIFRTTLGLSILAASSFIVSCKEEIYNKELDNPQVNHVEIDLSKQDTARLSGIYSKKQIIRLDNSLSIGEITSVRTCGDYIFIGTDSKRSSLLIIDRQGNLIKKIPDKDEPFEKGRLISLQYMHIDCKNEQLEIFDRASSKIVIFDFEGNYQDEFAVNLWATSFVKLNDNEYLFNCGYELNGEIQERLVVFNRSQSKPSSSYLKIDKRKLKYLLLNDLVNFVDAGDDLLYLSAFSDTVYFFNKKRNQIMPGYILKYGDDHLSDKAYNREYEHIADFLNQIRSTDRAFFMSGWFNLNNNILTSIEKGGKRYHITINKSVLKPRVISHYRDDLFFEDAIDPTSFENLPKWVNYDLNEAYFVKYPSDFVGKIKTKEGEESIAYTDNPVLLIYNIL